MLSKKNDRLKIITIGMLFLTASLYRAFSLFPPPLSADAAAYANQAFHVLQGRIPLFYYGQKFMGTGGAILIAVFYKIFGLSHLTLLLFAWLNSALFLFLSIYLGYRMFGYKVSLLTSVFFLFPPSRKVLEWTAESRPDYTLTFIFVPIILLLTYLIIDNENKSLSGKKLIMLLGISSGFAAWNNLLITPALIISFLFLVVYLKKLFFKKYFITYAVFFAAGSFPLIYANLRMDFFIFKMGATGSTSNLFPKVSAMLTNALPFFWGTRFADAQRGLALIFFGIFLLWVLCLYGIFSWNAVTMKNAPSRKLAYQIILSYFLFHLFVALISHFGKRFFSSYDPINYIMPLYAVAFIIPSAVIVDIKIRPALKALLALPLIFFLGNSFNNTRTKARQAISYLQSHANELLLPLPVEKSPLLELCREENMKCGYVNGLGVHKIRFLYMEKIIFSNSYEENYLPYALAVDSARKIFWRKWRYDEWTKLYDALGLAYKKSSISGGLCYDFRKKDISLNRMIRDFSISASINLSAADFMKDDLADTLWSTGRAQKAGDSFTLKLTETRLLDKIVLIPKSHKTLPNSFTLMVSADAQKWENICHFKRHPGSVFYSVFHPFIKIVKPRMELSLQGKHARFVKIVINEEGKYPLSISHIYVYGKAGTQPKVFIENIDEMLSDIQKIEKDILIVADHWFVNYFQLKGHDTEYLSNRFIDNYGTENPFIDNQLPLNMNERPFLIICEKAQTEDILSVVLEEKLKYQKKEYKLYDTLLIKPGPTQKAYYWDGLGLQAVYSEKEGRDPVSFPLLRENFSNARECQVNFGDIFCLNAYAIINEEAKRNIKIVLDITAKKNTDIPYFIFIHFCDEKDRILFQSDFLLKDHFSTADSWLPGRRILMERNVEFPESAKGKKVKVKLGIWNPKEKTVLFFDSDQQKFVIDKLEL